MPGEHEHDASSVVPTLSDGVIIMNGYTDDDVADHVAGEDEETARRFGWWPRRSTEHDVRAHIAADNMASRRVAENNGFLAAGTFTDQDGTPMIRYQQAR